MGYDSTFPKMSSAFSESGEYKFAELETFQPYQYLGNGYSIGGQMLLPQSTEPYDFDKQQMENLRERQNNPL